MDTLILVVVVAVFLAIGFKMFAKQNTNTTTDFPVAGGGGGSSGNTDDDPNVVNSPSDTIKKLQ